MRSLIRQHSGFGTWTALCHLILVCASVSSAAPISNQNGDYVIKYQIPGAHVLHWNYYPLLNCNHKFGPPKVDETEDKLLPSKKQVIWTTTTLPPTTSTTARPTTTTTSTTISFTAAPSQSKFGNKPEDDEDVQGFLEWVAENPPPQAELKPGDDDYEFPVLVPLPESEQSKDSDFAIVGVPARNVKCPTGQRFVNGVCRRGLISRPKPSRP